MTDFYDLLNTIRKIDEAEFDKEFAVNKKGKAQNFNIKDSERAGPYMDVKTPSGKIRRYYGSPENLEKYKSLNSRAKDAEIVDPNASKASAEPAPQTSAELDADSADSGTPPGTNITQADIDAQGAAAADAGMDNKPAEPSADDVDSMDSGTPAQSKPASAGSDLTKLDQAGADKAASQKLARMLELIQAMQESAAIFRNAGILTERELTPAEAEELKKLQAELGDLAKNPNLSPMNAKQIQAQLKRVPADIPTAQDDIDAQGAAAAQAGIDGPADAAADAGAEPKAEPKAEPAREPSGSLDAFSKAGQGGLANNPEETEAIKELQTELQALGFDPKGIDGKYGPGTVAAVKAFQKDKGLTADGDAGPDTIAAILRAEPEAEKGAGTKILDAIKALLNKASIGPDVTSTVDSPIAASIDFTSSIGKGIFESVNLKEALSSEDQMKLQGLLNKLNKEHPDLAKQNAEIFKKAQTFVKTGKIAAPGTPVKGKVAGSSGGTLPNSDARGQKPNAPAAEPAAAAGKAAPKQQGTTTTSTSTKANMKGIAITAAIRKTPEWKQFYKKPVAPKRSLETAAIRKADLAYKDAIAQGKIKPPAGASVDAKTTTKNPDGSTTTTTVGKGQNSPTVKSVRDEFAKMDKAEQEKGNARMGKNAKTYMNKGPVSTDF